MAKTNVQHVEFTRSIDTWLRAIGLRDDETVAEAAVDLADLLHAATDVREMLERLKTVDTSTPEGADQALQLAANIEVQLFTEIKTHLGSLERSWPLVLQQLDRQE